MARILTITNLKGGVGKSTIAVNLACELAARDGSIVLVDSDPQQTATLYASRGKLTVPVEALPLEGDVRVWIKRILSIEADYVVLDCPPFLGAIQEAATAAADLVLIPATPSMADLAATQAAIESIHRARASRPDKGPRAMLIPSRVDHRTGAGREFQGVLAQFGETIGPEIRQRAAFVDAMTAGLPVGEYDPRSQAHQDVQALTTAVMTALKGVKQHGTAKA